MPKIPSKIFFPFIVLLFSIGVLSLAFLLNPEDTILPKGFFGYISITSFIAQFLYSFVKYSENNPYSNYNHFMVFGLQKHSCLWQDILFFIKKPPIIIFIVSIIISCHLLFKNYYLDIIALMSNFVGIIFYVALGNYYLSYRTKENFFNYWMAYGGICLIALQIGKYYSLHFYLPTGSLYAVALLFVPQTEPILLLLSSILIAVAGLATIFILNKLVNNKWQK